MVRRSAQRSGDLSSAAGSRRTRIASMPFFSNSVAIPPHRHFARAFHASSLAALSSSSAASSAFSQRVRRRLAASAESRSGTSILRETSNSLEALRPETGVSRAKVTGGAHFANWAAHGFGGNASGSTGTRRGGSGGRPEHASDTARIAAAVARNLGRVTARTPVRYHGRASRPNEARPGRVETTVQSNPHAPRARVRARGLRGALRERRGVRRGHGLPGPLARREAPPLPAPRREPGGGRRAAGPRAHRAPRAAARELGHPRRPGGERRAARVQDRRLTSGPAGSRAARPRYRPGVGLTSGVLVALALAAIGAVAGSLGALLGIGGGVIIVPALSELYGVPFRHAVAASLVVIVASSSASSAAYVERGAANLRVGVVLELATVAGALLGSGVAGLAPVPVLKLLFALVALYSAVMLWVGRRDASDSSDASAQAVHGWAPGLAMSAVAGAISGLLGVGGGLFKMPGMTLAMGIPFKVAAATSNFMIGVTAAAGAYVYFARGELDPQLAAPLVVGVFAGAMLGSSLLPRLPARRLQGAFAMLLVFLGGRMIWGVLGGAR